MVQKYIMFEEEDDIEALRLAALQTIRPRKDVLRPIAPVTPHRQVEKQSFCRHVTNPNLIAIVPTDPKRDFEISLPPPLKNGTEGRNNDVHTTSLRNNEKDEEKSRNEKPQDKEKCKVRFKKNEATELNEINDETTEKSTATSNASNTSGNKASKNVKVNFDEDELDFEGDTVMLHDDDDSLDRLMDEMEQEFNQESPSSSVTPGQIKAKELKTTSKAACPVTSSDSEKNRLTVSSKDQSASKKTSGTSRPQSPNGYPSVKSLSNSPPLTQSSPSVRRRYSPSPPPRRRSPCSPRLKKRRSFTPPRRRSKSPIGGRNIGSSKYSRMRSPYTNKYNGRKSSESPRRRNSPPSPCRKCSTRNPCSPQRRKFSPPSKRRSPRRSPNRSAVQVHSSVEPKHHWRSPYSKKISSKRNPRNPKNAKVTSSEKVAEGNYQEKIEKKSANDKILETMEKVSKEDPKHLEIEDPKFEARRRKFESSSFITPRNKKICLKSSCENTSKKTDKRTVESDDVSPHRTIMVLNDDVNDDEDTSSKSIPSYQQYGDISPSYSPESPSYYNVSPSYRAESPCYTAFPSSNSPRGSPDYGPISPSYRPSSPSYTAFPSSNSPSSRPICPLTRSDYFSSSLQISSSSKVPLDSQNKKAFPQEFVKGRRVTEFKKREISPQPSTNKKKTIILDDSDHPESVRLDVPESRQKSKMNKLYGEKSSIKKEKSVLIVENEIDEDFIQNEVVKKVAKKKKKSKELKRKREYPSTNRSSELQLGFEDNDEEKSDKGNTSSSKTQEASKVNKSGLDLRAELSRRRAERLKGVTNPMARIIQSAFEDVVANRKKFESRCTNQEKDLENPTTSGLVFKSRGSRRVHVLDESPTKASATQYKDAENNEMSNDGDYFSDDDDSNEKFTVSSAAKRNTRLRTNMSGSGRSILRRSQV